MMNSPCTKDIIVLALLCPLARLLFLSNDDDMKQFEDFGERDW